MLGLTMGDVSLRQLAGLPSPTRDRNARRQSLDGGSSPACSSSPTPGDCSHRRRRASTGNMDQAEDYIAASGTQGPSTAAGVQPRPNIVDLIRQRVNASTSSSTSKQPATTTTADDRPSSSLAAQSVFSPLRSCSSSLSPPPQSASPPPFSAAASSSRCLIRALEECCQSPTKPGGSNGAGTALLQQTEQSAVTASVAAASSSDAAYPPPPSRPVRGSIVGQAPQQQSQQQHCWHCKDKEQPIGCRVDPKADSTAACTHGGSSGSSTSSGHGEVAPTNSDASTPPCAKQLPASPQALPPTSGGSPEVTQALRERVAMLEKLLERQGSSPGAVPLGGSSPPKPMEEAGKSSAAGGDGEGQVAAGKIGGGKRQGASLGGCSSGSTDATLSESGGNSPAAADSSAASGPASASVDPEVISAVEQTPPPGKGPAAKGKGNTKGGSPSPPPPSPPPSGPAASPQEKQPQQDDSAPSPAPCTPGGKGPGKGGKGKVKSSPPPPPGATSNSPAPKGKGKGPPGAAPKAPPRGGAAAKAGAGKSGPAPRKADAKPQVALKRLFWNSFVLDQEQLDKYRSTVWMAIEESDSPESFDVEELERTFAEMQPGRSLGRSAAAGSATGGRSAKPTKLRAFEESRRRQVCVMLARLPPVDITVAAVAEMDDSRLDKDQVELLLATAPTAEELTMLRGVAASQEEPAAAWDDAEAFVLKLGEVPSFALRLQVWMFENTFEERYALFHSGVTDVRDACHALRESQRAQRLLCLVLSMGNHLNAGTSRGRADGFGIEVLVQLPVLKGQAATFIEFLVRQAERSHPGDLDGLFGELGEATLVQRATRHKLADLSQELASYQTQAEGLARHAAALEDQALGIRAQRVEARIKELVSLRKLFEDADKDYAELCVWFHEGGSKKPRPPDEFFGFWNGFFQAVRSVLEGLYGGKTRRRKAAPRSKPLRPLEAYKRSLTLAETVKDEEDAKEV